jgi:hydroxymethylbilane synthase
MLKIGSRGSQLALWQARHIAARLAELGVETEIEIIRTTGDRVTDVPLARAGGKGLFTKEIEEALLDGRIHLAVHSLKDLPTTLPAGLVVAAIPERESALDALVGRTLDELAPCARVGTSSPRRAAQLRRLRPDLRVENVRGNLDTRLRKLDEGQFDAILLAAAGLRRLGCAERIGEELDPLKMCPAVGQGALAIETRAEGEALRVCAQLDHAPTRAAVTAERALLGALGGGCQVPIGAYAVAEGGRLRLRAVVCDVKGTRQIETECEAAVSDALELGRRAAADLLARGAGALLGPLAGQRVLVTRAAAQAEPLTAALNAAGAVVIELPMLAFEPLPFVLPDWAAYDWAIFTSANGVEHFFARVVPRRGPRICAIGEATADALRAHGLTAELVPGRAVGEGVLQALADVPMADVRVLLVRAEQARDVIVDGLRERGARLDVLPVYRTVAPPELDQKVAEIWATARPDWVTLTSGSVLRNLLSAAGAERLREVKLATLGPVTAAEVRRAGLTVAAEADAATVEALVAAIAGARS